MNEFITNSLKHAFDGGPGTVGTRLRADMGGGIRLELWDDGRGIPAKPTGAPAEAKAGETDTSDGGTGMRMIGSLARQLGTAPDWGAGEGGRGVRLALTVRWPATRPDDKA